MQQLLSLLLIYTMLVQSCAGRNNTPTPTKTAPQAADGSATSSVPTPTTPSTFGALGDPIEIICSQAVNGALTVTPSMPVNWVFSARNTAGVVPITSITAVNGMGQRPTSMMISGSNVSFTAAAQYDLSGQVTVVAGNGTTTNQKVFSWSAGNQTVNMSQMMLPMMMMMIPSLLSGAGGLFGGGSGGGGMGSSGGGGILSGGGGSSGGGAGYASGGSGYAGGNSGGGVLSGGGQAVASGGTASGGCATGNCPKVSSGSGSCPGGVCNVNLGGGSTAPKDALVQNTPSTGTVLGSGAGGIQSIASNPSSSSSSGGLLGVPNQSQPVCTTGNCPFAK